MLAIRAVVLGTLLLGLLSGPAHGRAVWRFRTFTSRDGLAHDIVRDVLEASDGSIWFATMGGVTRYAPATCSYLTFSPGGGLPRQEAMSLAQTPDGTVWVATQGGGVASYSGNVWTWHTTRDGLPSDEITSLMVDRSGRVWATPTTGGIAMHDGHRWRVYTADDGLSPGEIGRCAERRDGAIVCGTYEQPVLQLFDDGKWTQLRVDAPARRHFYVHALTESASGELWLATKGAGAIRGTPTGDGRYSWTVFDRSAGLASNRVGAVRQARDGSIWLATSAGASRFDGKSWRSFSVRDGLGGNQVFAITQTRDGALWFATLGGGAARYSPSRWERTTEEHGLASDNLTGGLLVTKTRELWVGTDRGINILNIKDVGAGGKWSTEATGLVPLDYVNHLLQAADGSIWVATRNGLRRHDGRWTHLAPGQGGPPHAVANRLAQDRQGRVWVAASGGVSAFDGKQWTTYSTKEGLPASRVYDVAADRHGRIWVATENGVARWDGKAWTPFLSPEPASRTNRIYSLALATSGQLWASGLEGVAHLDDRRGERWHRMEPNPWLPAGIYSRFVVATDDGSLWFAVRGLGVRRLIDDRWTAFPAAEEGLVGETVRDVKTLPDGTILFATLGGGLSSYRPDRHPPQTFVGSQGEGAGGASRGAPSSVIRGEDVVIHFSGQDVLKDTRTEDLLYSHRVDNGPWSSFSPETRAWLTDLEAGAHLFEVRAMDRDLNIDPTPARHTLRVVRPWWAEPYVLGIFGLSLLLVAYAVFRIVQAMARERTAMLAEQAVLDQRRQFVRLASHELRKPLARLAHRAEMLALPESQGNREKLEEYTAAMVADSTHLSRLVETLLEQARIQEGLVLELRAGDLGEVAEKVIGEFREDTGGPPRLTRQDGRLPVQYDPFYLPLAIRNLLENAVKYGGGPHQVEVACARKERQATIVVRDHGPGIPEEDRERIFAPFFRGRTRPEHGGFGLGLSFARDIARAHAGDLVLLDSDEGAAFCLSLPLKTAEEDRGPTADHR